MGRRRRSSAGPERNEKGAPLWFVTYADMISLLLCFFCSLFSVSDQKSMKVFDMVQSFRSYFDLSELPPGGFLTQPVDEVIESMAGKAFDLSGISPGGPPAAAVKTRREREVPHSFGPHAHVSKIRRDELKVTIEGTVTFDPGEVVLKPEAREIVGRVAQKIVGRKLRVRVVGHASPAPLPQGAGRPAGEIHVAYRDHHDLALERARAIVEEFLSLRFRQDGSLVRPDDPDANDAGRYQMNPRRFEISSLGANEIPPGTDILDPREQARLNRVEILLGADPILVAEPLSGSTTTERTDSGGGKGTEHGG